MSENTFIYPVGIDLGTTNSAIAVFQLDMLELIQNKEGTRINPSYVYREPNNILIGRIARDKGSVDPGNVCFDSKRLLAETMESPKIGEFRKLWPFEVTNKENDTDIMKAFYRISKDKKQKGYQLVSPERISSDILKSMLDDAITKLDVQADQIQAVITVPAYFNINQKRATIEAAKFAGIEVKRLLSEPVAAALAYQQEVNIGESENEESIFVFDLGGGTFDVTIMKMGKGSYDVIALGGDSHLGGRDFDNVIAKMVKQLLKDELNPDLVDEKMKQAIYRHRLIEISRGVKETLTQADEDTVILSDIIFDATEAEITRKEFEEKSEDLWKKISDCCYSTLKDAKLTPDEIDHVILVGGSSRMKKVTEIMQEIFGKEKKISRSLSPDESIAKGAALLSGRLIIHNEESFKNAIPQSIGIEVAGNRFEVLINHNTPIPCEVTKIFKTPTDGQEEAQIPIYEGLSEDLDENTYIGTFKISDIPRRGAGEVTVEVNLKVDYNGILQCEANAIIDGVSSKIKVEIDYEIKFDFDIIEVAEE